MEILSWHNIITRVGKNGQQKGEQTDSSMRAQPRSQTVSELKNAWMCTLPAFRKKSAVCISIFNLMRSISDVYTHPITLGCSGNSNYIRKYKAFILFKNP